MRRSRLAYLAPDNLEQKPTIKHSLGAVALISFGRVDPIMNRTRRLMLSTALLNLKSIEDPEEIRAN